jgi:hypothetical protein
MGTTFEDFVFHATRWALAGGYATRTGDAALVRAEQRHFDRAGAALERLQREAGIDPAEWWRTVWTIRGLRLSAQPGSGASADGSRS